ncbi:unnamed protein product [Rotaria magnacalcarata]|uniref:Uncharacterized protein n=2 Tax=Rotaria magnacalcarata TaxID=392030 RepID=A0A815WQ03_9BILA|nr:unnamed protein product [Rotaria magnacalcarata]CAF5191294.1 unnamed protein product [Rotaria magnacalcarata]
MIPIQYSQNEQWDLFENAATYSYARSILQTNKNNNNLTINHGKSSKTLTTMDSNIEKATVNQHKTIQNLYELMTTFQSTLNETQKALEQTNSRMENRLDQISKSLESTRNTTSHGKIKDQTVARPTSETSSVKSDASFRNQATTSTRKSAQ